MTDYTSIKVDKDTHEQLADDKPDGVTWDYYLSTLYRNAKAFERGEGE